MASVLHEHAPMRLNALTASEASRRIQAGEATSERLVLDCLDRIHARDPLVEAWEFLDPEHALAQARALDVAPRRGPLHGVPVAIKDIFDTFDMPTSHGFPPLRDKASKQDSYCVAALRGAGMVILGKTVTTEFACPVPRHTRNPHDFARSPGVSSSGSAAAIADFMAPLALGSQTGGSIIVPAAFCGVYGYKSSPGGLDRAGYRHCKPTLDSIGVFARCLDDLILMRSTQGGGRFDSPEAPPRIAFVEPPSAVDLDDAMRGALRQAETALRGAGATVASLRLPQRFGELDACFRIINGWETSIALAVEIRDQGRDFNAFNRSKLDFIASLSIDRYKAALEELRAAQFEMDRLMAPYDILVAPSAPGEALPFSVEVVPDECAKLWSLLQMPAINIPLTPGPGRLPLGLQLIGKRNYDDGLLATARWIDRRLRSSLTAP